ncbi:DALR anticodon-binding domain-containing protein, partial [Escherichia coli]|nr:DALR anticodon-binding domain-containing protein [Escherichia coli]
RAGSIFRKLDAGKRARAEELVRRAAEDEQAAEALRCVFDGEAGDELWALVTLAARLEETTAQAAAMEEPAHLAKYAFQLA